MRGFPMNSKDFHAQDGSQCPVSIKGHPAARRQQSSDAASGASAVTSTRAKAEAALKLAGKVYAASHQGNHRHRSGRLILTANPAYSESTGYRRRKPSATSPRFLLNGQMMKRSTKNCC